MPKFFLDPRNIKKNKPRPNPTSTCMYTKDYIPRYNKEFDSFCPFPNLTTV